MSFNDLLQNVTGVLDQVGDVVQKGSDVVGDVSDQVQGVLSLTGYDPTDVGGEIGGFPSTSTGPISAPAVKSSSTTGGATIDKKFLVIGAMVLGFLLLRK